MSYNKSAGDFCDIEYTICNTQDRIEVNNTDKSQHSTLLVAMPSNNLDRTLNLDTALYEPLDVFRSAGRGRTICQLVCCSLPTCLRQLSGETLGGGTNGTPDRPC